MKNTISNILCNEFPTKIEVTSGFFDEKLVKKILKFYPKRLKHTFGVREIAENLFSSIFSPDQQRKLITATLFHDIGYSEDLIITGFHPLDGAIFLAHHGFDDDILRAILNHTGAIGEANYHGIAKTVYEKLPLHKTSDIDDALTFCDLRTSPVGEPVTPDERYKEIIERYGKFHYVSQNIMKWKQEFNNITQRIIKRVNDIYSDNLPWLFIDIDNTLIVPGHDISKINQDAIHSYLTAGGKISLATGKHPQAIKSLIGQLNLDTHQISGNGAVIISENHSEPIEDILGVQGMKIQNLLYRDKIPHAIYTIDNIHFSTECTDQEHIQMLIDINEPRPINDLISNWDRVFKILIFANHKNISLEKFLKHLAHLENLTSVRTSSEFVEIMSKATSKATAMKYILTHYKWPMLYTAALGDSENDLSILRTVGIPAVVGNASVTASHAVPFAVSSCKSNGAAEFINLLKNNYLGGKQCLK